MVRLAPARLWALVAVQLVLLGAIAWIDYGWGGPGQFGLRVDHQLLALLVYGVLWIGGVVWAVRRRAWNALAVQTVAPLALLLWTTGFGFPLDPDRHQNLVGMTRAEAMEALDGRRGRWISETGDSLGSVLTYHGLDVHLIDERRITRIAPGEDPVPTPSMPPLVAAEHQDLVGTPYPTAYRALIGRGGVDYTSITGDSLQFNGVCVYYAGEERVRRVTPPGSGG